MPCRPTYKPKKIGVFDGLDKAMKNSGHYWKQRVHRTAAVIHISLLKIRREPIPEKLTSISWGHTSPSMNEVQNLCAKLRECGGSTYTAQLVLVYPNKESIAKLHAWCVEHEKEDAEAEDD